MQRILITGGAGFIGSNLALYLLKNNYTVTVLDNLSKQIHGDDAQKTSPLFKTIQGKVNFIHGDVLDNSLLEQLVTNNDVIVHFAAETGTGQSMYQIAHYTNVNIQATANLLDILTNKSHSVKKLVIASSRSIYGEGKYLSSKYGYVYPTSRVDTDLKNGFFETTYLEDKNLQIVATDENSKLHPSSVYGISKLVQEQMIMTVCPSIGINAVALRYQNVYGPGQSLQNPYTGILSIFSNCILNNKAINIFEDGLESRDFIYIDDIVKATFSAIVKDEANNEIFNVGSGVATTVNEIAKLLVQLYNKPNTSITISGNYRIGDIRHNYADLSKINKHLNFVPKFSLQQGLTNFTSWVSQQNITNSRYEDSLIELKQKGLFR